MPNASIPLNIDTRSIAAAVVNTSSISHSHFLLPSMPPKDTPRSPTIAARKDSDPGALPCDSPISLRRCHTPGDVVPNGVFGKTIWDAFWH
jgi:hypothetical protein